MAQLTAAQVYALALGAGLAPGPASVATAIAGWAGSPTPGESHGRTDAMGDLGIQDATWGPSVGVWQIRSVKAETGTGGTRDVRALTDPTRNAAAMATISGGGSNFGAWTVYKNGSYRTNLAALQKAGYTTAAGAGGSSSATPGAFAGAGGDSASGPIPAVATVGLNTSVLSRVGTLVDLLLGLLNPKTWLRIFQALGGVALIVFGAVILFRNDIAPTARPAATAA